MPQNNTPSMVAAGVRATYAKHPLCAASAMTAQQYQDLKDSLEAIGPTTPVLIADGMVLSGWDVYRACIELDMPFQIQELATSVEQVSAPTAVVLALESIRIDGNTQSRVELDQVAVAEYAEAMAEGAQFPPLIVFFDGASNWLADGFHRYFGARKAGLVQLAADVRQGTQQDAQLFSFGVNSAHGLRRTNADKRKAVTGALQHPVSGQWSDRQIAKHCGVSHPFVSSVRSSLVTVTSEKSSLSKLDSEKPAERTYTTKHGTTAVMNTSNIGKTDKPALAPAPTTAPAAAPVAPRTVSVVPPPKSSAPPSEEEDGFTLPEGMTEEDFGPSEEEIAAIVAADKAERELVAKMLAADDKLAMLHAEVTKLKAIIHRLERRDVELTNKTIPAEKAAKRFEAQNRRLHKELEALKKGRAQ